MDWSPEQIGELTRLWGEGLTTSEIGKRLPASARTPWSAMAHRLHLAARPSPIKRTGPRPQVFRDDGEASGGAAGRAARPRQPGEALPPRARRRAARALDRRALQQHSANGRSAIPVTRTSTSTPSAPWSTNLYCAEHCAFRPS